jgi:hypothetical protein
MYIEICRFYKFFINLIAKCDMKMSNVCSGESNLVFIIDPNNQKIYFLTLKVSNYKFYLRKGCVEGADNIQFKHLCKKFNQDLRSLVLLK